MVSWLIGDFQHLSGYRQVTFFLASYLHLPISPSPHLSISPSPHVQVQCGPKGREGIQDECCRAISADVARTGGYPRCVGMAAFTKRGRCGALDDIEGNEVNACV